MKTRVIKKAMLLMVSDCAAIALAFIVALLIGHRGDFAILYLLQLYRWGFVTFLLSTGLLFFVCDGYTLRKAPQRLSRQVILGFGLLTSSLISTTIFFFFREPVPRGVFILFYVNTFILIFLFRNIIWKFLFSSMSWRALIVGDGSKSLEVAQLIDSSPYLSSVVVGYVSNGNGELAQGKLTRLGDISSLVSAAKEKFVAEVIVAVPLMDDALNKVLLECMREKIKVSEFRRVIEEIKGSVPIDHLDYIWFLQELSTSNKQFFWYMKRAADLSVSCIGLCLALPLLPFIALLIKLDSPGPIFYCQQRMGRGNVPFRVWKLRTMVNGADGNDIHWTIANDPRITRLGRIVRKLRLDEVPQIINIFKGEMSLIGPRPEALSLVEMYTKAIPFYAERHIVTPGITGWAQINYPYGNSVEDTRQKLMYDFYYIKNRSVTLDIMIFLRTIKIVVTGKGAL